MPSRSTSSSATSRLYVGVPELSQETAEVTRKLCAKLLAEMGTNISLQEVDIAHRVPLRSAGNLPKPIIGKFTRRLAKEAVMARRKDACKPINNWFML